jgi:hypothetical protein
MKNAYIAKPNYDNMNMQIKYVNCIKWTQRIFVKNK